MREVVFVGPTQDEVRTFPDAARKLVGFALYRAQEGVMHPSAKPLKGFGGAGVLEIVADSDGNTYRTVYTVRLTTAIYVLHAFQKKSTHGAATPQREMDLVRNRLVWARHIDAVRLAEQGEKGRAMSSETTDTSHRVTNDSGEEMTYTVGSGNIFADLGVDAPEEHLVKAQLVGRIADAIAARGVTQVRASEILGVPQPKVSALLHGDFTGFSLERLFRLLVALDNDISIVVEPKSKEQGHVSVVAR